jgi:2-iminobutanoate/2-iminopropanoate deaminase
MSSIAKKIETKNAPKAIGPYSQAVSLKGAKEIVFVSGQIPLDPTTGKLVEGDIRTKTRRVIDNIEGILKEAGSSLQQVLRVDIFLKNLKEDFQAVNEEYARKFTGSPSPARQTVQVSELPMGVPIEISCIAYIGEIA